MSQHQFIKIRGARVNNLQNIDVDIPLNKLVGITGPSGSGKTTLAFHTLLNESKRRFINSFPNSMKFFSDRPQAVDVDEIFPVLPVFGLPQINPIMSSRSVVSDIMRLTEQLQSFFYRFSEELCPVHLKKLIPSDTKEILRKKLTQDSIIHIFIKKEIYQKKFGHGTFPIRVFDKDEIKDFDKNIVWWEFFKTSSKNLDLAQKYLDELVGLSHEDIDLKILQKANNQIIDVKISFEAVCPDCFIPSSMTRTLTAFSPLSSLGACTECDGFGAKLIYDDERMFDLDLSIEHGGIKFLEFSPFNGYKNLLFVELKKLKISFTTPIGKLKKVDIEMIKNGIGKYPGFKDLTDYLETKKYKPAIRVFIRKMQKEEICKMCSGTRVKKDLESFKLKSNENFFSLQDIYQHKLNDIRDIFQIMSTEKSQNIKKDIADILDSLNIACDLGLGHLSLIRKSKTLSPGEYQRLLLIKYLSFKGTETLFILDEPSVGLSSVEIEKCLMGMKKLLKQGNSVVIVDHNEFLLNKMDHLIVMGPGAGNEGGNIVYSGTVPEKVKNIFKLKSNEIKRVKYINKDFFEVGASNIFDLNFSAFKIASQSSLWVTGPSGCGKNSLLVNILGNYLSKKVNGEFITYDPFHVDYIRYPKDLNSVFVISSQINRFTSRSSVGTITGLAPIIRSHFLKLPIVKSMGLKDGHLSSNSDLGMCLTCGGKGFLVIDMQYLEDIILECEDCKGMKIRPLYANISDGDMTVYESNNKPLKYVLEKVKLTPKFLRVKNYLSRLNLDYLSLERTLNSLSGGERQRIYLLSKILGDLKNSLIILENLSFGLSVKELWDIGLMLNDLRTIGCTLIIIDPHPLFEKICTDHLQFINGKLKISSII